MTALSPLIIFFRIAKIIFENNIQKVRSNFFRRILAVFLIFTDYEFFYWRAFLIEKGGEEDVHVQRYASSILMLIPSMLLSIWF